MIGDSRWGTWLAHAILILGIVIVAFPLYYVFIASTHPMATIISPPMPLTTRSSAGSSASFEESTAAAASISLRARGLRRC